MVYSIPNTYSDYSMFAEEGFIESDISKLKNPKICATVEIEGEKYWVWVALTKKGVLLHKKTERSSTNG